MCMYVCISMQNYGGLGAWSPRNVLEMKCSEIACEAILGQKQTHGSRSISSNFWLSMYAFAKMQPTSNFHERKYYGWKNSRWGDGEYWKKKKSLRRASSLYEQLNVYRLQIYTYMYHCTYFHAFCFQMVWLDPACSVAASLLAVNH